AKGCCWRREALRGCWRASPSCTSLALSSSVRRSKMRTIVSAALFLLLSAPLRGQEPARIADNSFLIEEAYNQEAGVVQHISALALVEGGNWAYGFTQEW